MLDRRPIGERVRPIKKCRFFRQDRLSVFLHFLIIPGLVLYILRIDSLVNQIQNEHYVQQTEFKKNKK
jgi:hypothetical protein